MNVAMPAWSLGALIALIVLVVAIVLIFVHGNTYTLDLVAALAVARLT
jgi:hypothetical protein